MKTIIAGSRTIHNYMRVEQAVIDSEFDITEIVSGGAKGVDRLGEKFGKKKAIPIRIFPADWEKHGKKAGPVRNKRMARYADQLIAVWDGESSGTRDMLQKAYKQNLRIYLVHMGKEDDWRYNP